MKRIKDIVENKKTLGLFYQLFIYTQYDEDKPKWLDGGSAIYLDTLYMVRSRNKYIGKLIEYELDYYDTLLINDSVKQELIELIYFKFKHKWERYYNTLLQDYDALKDYDNSITRTPNINRNTKQSTSIKTEDNLNSFNTDLSKEVGNTKVVGELDNNEIDYNETGNEVTIESGTRGRSKQELIKEEINVLKNNFYDLIFNDLDSELTLSVY